MSDAIQTYGIRIKAMKENLRNIKKMKKDIDSIQKHQSRERHRAMVKNKESIVKESKFAEQTRDQDQKDFKQSQKNLTKIQKQEAERRKKVGGSASDKDKYKKKQKDFDIVQKALTKTLKKESDRRQQIELAEAKRQNRVNKGRTQQAISNITERSGKGKGDATKVHGALADQLKAEEKEYNRAEKEFTKIKKQEADKRLKLEKESVRRQVDIQNARTKQAVSNITERSGKGRGDASKTLLAEQEKSFQRDKADLARRQREVESARVRQAVSQTTERAGKGRGTAAKSALADQLREEVRLEKEAQTINNKINRLEKQRVNSLEKAKKAISRSALMKKQDADAGERAAQQAIREAMATSKTADQLRNAVATEKSNLATNKRLTKEKQRQMYLQRRISESSKQFAGNYLSAFAAAGAATGITRVGQDFQSVNNTMLAVSENSEAAGDNFKFVRDEAYRLGLGLTESSKGFSKMLAARGDMSVEETKEAFSGLSEMSTLLGLSAEESSRSINALQQMMSKGVVTNEELKLQMGDVLPNAIPLMAKAAKDAGLTVNGTVKEMIDLQEKGELISSKVLPHFAKRLREAARANGGLDKAMKSNRVAMNQLIMSSQEAADIFFRGGFEEGLSEFFRSSAEFIRGNSDLWKSLGAIIGSVLKGVAIVIKFITPVFETFGFVLRNITDLLGDFSATLLPFLSPLGWVGLNKLIGKFNGIIPLIGQMKKGFIALGGVMMRSFVGKILLAFVALEEIINLFTGEKAGILRDDSQPDSYQMDRALKFLGVIDKDSKPEKPDMETFTGRLKNVGNAILKGNSTERLIAGSSFWARNIQQVIEVVIDGEKVGEAVVNSDSGQEGVKRLMRNDAHNNY